MRPTVPNGYHPYTSRELRLAAKQVQDIYYRDIMLWAASQIERSRWWRAVAILSFAAWLSVAFL